MAGVAGGAGRGGCEDDHERGGGRFVDALAEQEDEDRDGEHGAAAADGAERDAEKCPGGERDQHASRW